MPKTKSKAAQKATIGAGATPANQELCGVCCAAVVDGEGDALQCEGSCQLWLHRCCAGLPVGHFKRLSNSPEPFFCVYCLREKQDVTISQLRSEIVSLKAEICELRSSLEAVRSADTDVIDTLIKSVKKLNEDMTSVPRSQETTSARDKGQPWKKVIRRGRKKFEPQDAVGSKDAVLSQGEKSQSQVNGARKIWGTLKHTTVGAVSSAIKSLAKVPTDSLVIKRKFKSVLKDSRQVTVRWWFVVRGDEKVLCDLQERWTSVAIQTSWKLQPVLEYSPTLNNNTDNGACTTIVPTSAADINPPVDTSTISGTSIVPINKGDTVSSAKEQSFLANSPKLPSPT